MRRRVDDTAVDSNEGPPGLEVNRARYNPLMLDPLVVPSTLETLKDAGDKKMATEAGLQEIASSDRVAQGVHQPLSRESSTVTPDSLPLSIQLPPSTSSFDKNRAPAQAPTLDSNVSITCHLTSCMTCVNNIDITVRMLRGK